MEKLKVGDRVRIKNNRGSGWNIDGDMDKYFGKEVIIYQVLVYDLFRIKDGDKTWSFHYSDIEEIISESESTLETQIKQVLTHLQDNPITSWEAINTYKITRLSAVIYKLRKNYTITSVWEDNNKVGKDKKRWTKYTLIK